MIVMWAKSARTACRLTWGVAAIAILLALVVDSSPLARADTFHLVSGGAVEGEWLNARQPGAQVYEIRLPGGGTIRLAAEQVRETVRETPDQIEYRRIAPGYPDTVEAQWKLAQWCLERRLMAEREPHLRRILELEPDHLGARRGLGYSQVNGQWVESEAWRKENGYYLYQGKWRLPQEIEIFERRKKQELAEKEWMARLRRMRAALADPAKQVEAQQQFAAITDPSAVGPLAEALKREPLRPVKLLYIETLGRIGEPAAPTLLDLSLADHDEEIRYSCVDQLERLKPPGVQKFYLKALQGKDNWQVNRAAYALGRLGDNSAISPLVDALITTHVFTAPSSGGSGDAVSTSFSPAGGTSFQAGASPKSVRLQVPNQDVLKSLILLTGGVSFNFDVPRWRTWLASRAQAGQR